MAKLTWKQRKKLAREHPEEFVFPELAPGHGTYPIPDSRRAHAALAYVARFGSASDQQAVCEAVHERFPKIHEKSCRLHG